jgi:hypothetical protein
MAHIKLLWSGWQDLNPRPTGPKPVALPNCATPRNFWQGQKDLNPRHAVLETAALPAELYPYAFIYTLSDANFQYGGEDGIRTHAALKRTLTV